MLLQPGWYLTCCIGTANLCAVKSGTEQHPCLLPGGGYLFSVTCLLQEQSFLSCWILPPVGEVDTNFFRLYHWSETKISNKPSLSKAIYHLIPLTDLLMKLTWHSLALVEFYFDFWMFQHKGLQSTFAISYSTPSMQYFVTFWGVYQHLKPLNSSAFYTEGRNVCTDVLVKEPVCDSCICVFRLTCWRLL